MKSSLIISILLLVLSCNSKDNTDTPNQELEKISFNVPELDSVSNSITPFVSECREYFEELFIQADVWEDGAFIKEFVSFTPIEIIDQTKVKHSTYYGKYLYTIHGIIENGDTSLWSQASFFNNEQQILIPVHINQNKIVFDTLLEIYLPFRNIKIECLDIKTDTVFERGEGYYGIWQRVDENHNPL